jgi:hypothetical protein
MRRFPLVLLVLLAALGVCLAPSRANASPQCVSPTGCLDFSLTAPGGITLDGYFTYTPPPPASGIYVITGADLWFSDPEGKVNPTPPPAYLPVINSTTELLNQVEYDPVSIVGPPTIYSYSNDNLFYLSLDPATGTEFDQHGLFLWALDPVDDLIAIKGVTNSSGGPASQNLVEVVFTDGTHLNTLTDYFRITPDNPSGTGVTLTPVGSLVDLPESGSLSMLVLCAIALAGAFFFEARQISFSQGH